MSVRRPHPNTRIMKFNEMKNFLVHLIRGLDFFSIKITIKSQLNGPIFL